MDGHGMRSQERVAHFAQTSESGSEKVRVEQYISGQTFHPVPPMLGKIPKTNPVFFFDGGLGEMFGHLYIVQP